MAQGEFAHLEIPADDPAVVIPFYAGVFGWKISLMDGMDDYHVFMSGPGNSGGAIGRRGVNVAEHLRAYIDVDSIDVTLETVARLGGSVREPKTEIPGIGWFAVIADPEGGEMALYEAVPGGTPSR
jgi:uncharacterized protein